MFEKNDVLQKLSQNLDPSRVASRQGAGGRSLSYLETYDVINRLNMIFGFDGWSDSLVSFEPIGNPAEPRLFRATVELQVRIGTEWVKHSDVGIGLVNGANWAQESVEKAVKEAASDALKRAARKLGDQFGNCLYDKHAPEHAGGQQRTQAPQARPQAQQPRSTAPAAQNGHAQGSGAQCPKCQGAMWDNRQKKANGEMGDNRPDFSCKNRECKGAFWPPKDGQAPRRAFRPIEEPQGPSADDLEAVWAMDAARAEANTAFN